MGRGYKNTEVEANDTIETSGQEQLILLPTFSSELVETLHSNENIKEVYFIKDGSYSFRSFVANDGIMYTRCYEALEDLKGGILGAKKILIGYPECMVTNKVSRDTILK